MLFLQRYKNALVAEKRKIYFYLKKNIFKFISLFYDKRNLKFKKSYRFPEIRVSKTIKTALSLQTKLSKVTSGKNSEKTELS